MDVHRLQLFFINDKEHLALVLISVLLKHEGAKSVTIFNDEIFQPSKDFRKGNLDGSIVAGHLVDKVDGVLATHLEVELEDGLLVRHRKDEESGEGAEEDKKGDGVEVLRDEGKEKAGSVTEILELLNETPPVGSNETAYYCRIELLEVLVQVNAEFFRSHVIVGLLVDHKALQGMLTITP